MRSSLAALALLCYAVFAITCSCHTSESGIGLPVQSAVLLLSADMHTAHVRCTATLCLMGDAGSSSALSPRPGSMAGERPRLSQYFANEFIVVLTCNPISRSTELAMWLGCRHVVFGKGAAPVSGRGQACERSSFLIPISQEAHVLQASRLHAAHQHLGAEGCTPPASASALPGLCLAWMRVETEWA